MNNLAKCLLDNEEVTAIINAKHQDIFSVLGMHKHPTEHGIIVRSFYPDALGHHDKLVFVVHDLHMLQPGYYRPFKTTWCRAFFGR